MDAIPASALKYTDMRFLSHANPDLRMPSLPAQEVGGCFTSWEGSWNGIKASLRVTFDQSWITAFLPISEKLIQEGLCELVGSRLLFVAKVAECEQDFGDETCYFKVTQRIDATDKPATYIDFGSVDEVPEILKGVTPSKQYNVIQWDAGSAKRPIAPIPGRIRRISGPDAEDWFATPIQKDQVERGAEGERLVAELLHERSQKTPGMTVRELNDQDGVGMGHDFEVFMDGELCEVIEVKTTAGPVGTPVKISALQFLEALKYHELQGPVKFSLYCVFQADRPDPTVLCIEDPIAYLVAGKLALESDVVVSVGC